MMSCSGGPSTECRPRDTGAVWSGIEPTEEARLGDHDRVVAFGH